MNTELERARANLADAEASLAAGTSPYAQQNVDTFRARVARIEAAVIAPPPAAASTPSPVLAAPAPKPAPTPTGTRVERLQRIATSFGTDARTLEAAIDGGLSPDEFAVVASDEAVAKAKAAEIIAA